MALLKTRTLVITAGAPVTLLATIQCVRVSISEDRSVANYPTVGMKAIGPESGSTVIQKDIGEAFIFKSPRGMFRANDTICSGLEAVTGSTTVQVIEEG